VAKLKPIAILEKEIDWSVRERLLGFARRIIPWEWIPAAEINIHSIKGNDKDL